MLKKVLKVYGFMVKLIYAAVTIISLLLLVTFAVSGYIQYSSSDEIEDSEDALISYYGYTTDDDFDQDFPDSSDKRYSSDKVSSSMRMRYYDGITRPYYTSSEVVSCSPYTSSILADTQEPLQGSVNYVSSNNDCTRLSRPVCYEGVEQTRYTPCITRVDQTRSVPGYVKISQSKKDCY